MSDEIVTPRFAHTQRCGSSPNMSNDIEEVFWKAGYEVEVTRLSLKRYRVTFQGNPWKRKLEDDIVDEVGEEMDKHLSKWRYWRLQEDSEVPDSWLLTAP